MHNRGQNGSVITLVSIVILVLLVVGLGIFAFSAYSGQQDYKNNSDKKAAEAVAEAEKTLTEKLRAEFAEEAKKPTKSYTGPVSYGSVTFSYPKTWSAYIDETSSSQPLNGYFHPDKVPGIEGDTAYALRVELIDSAYSEVLGEYESAISEGQLTAVAYIPPKLEKTPNVQPGIRLAGNLGDSQARKDGSMVIIQVRDKTLKIYTESAQFMKDFDTTVLPSLAFLP